MYWCLPSIVGVTIFGLLLRRSIRKVTTNDDIIAHMDEFIGNFASGVFVMELRVIGRLHGRYSLPLLIAGYLHLFFKFSYFNRLGGFMSPLSFIASYYRNGRQIRFSLFFAASIIITQFVGLYGGQRLALTLWAFEDQTHIDAAKIACTTSMSVAYPWYHIALYEAFGVFLSVCVSAIIPSSLKEATGAFLTMTLYFFLSHISGSFFNPIIATAFSFRCSGHTSDWQHIAVYWIAPALSMIIALELLEGLKKLKGKKTAKKTE